MECIAPGGRPGYGPESTRGEFSTSDMLVCRLSAPTDAKTSVSVPGMLEVEHVLVIEAETGFCASNPHVKLPVRLLREAPIPAESWDTEGQGGVAFGLPVAYRPNPEAKTSPHQVSLAHGLPHPLSYAALLSYCCHLPCVLVPRRTQGNVGIRKQFLWEIERVCLLAQHRKHTPGGTGPMKGLTTLSLTCLWPYHCQVPVDGWVVVNDTDEPMGPLHGFAGYGASASGYI